MAADAEALLEVEFFAAGAAPGAYTGAERKGRVGKFELADGGTLRPRRDRGHADLAAEGKLLRALQDKEIEPIGSNRIIRPDVRIIAATSADLPALVEEGKFRADLYYRLNVVPICVPPLRQRQADLLPLAYAILEEICTRTERATRPVLSGLRTALLLGEHDWPGNVRGIAQHARRSAWR
ncbi:sigma 54-interacting transcriptional regulator [Cupriavidus basilensis]